MSMHHDWIESRIALSERLANGDCGGSSAESILILSSLISGLAADLWPGKSIDRYRFVELWARYSDPQLGANLVSVPLLIHELETRKLFLLSDRLRASNSEAFAPRELPDCLVVTGERVDVYEEEVSRIIPELPLAQIRESSYGNVFYVHYRSGYVHEYQAGTHVDEMVMSTTRSTITYGNFVDPPHRRINFEIPYLAAVARSVVLRVEPEWEHRPVPLPAQWWVAGAV